MSTRACASARPPPEAEVSPRMNDEAPTSTTVGFRPGVGNSEDDLLPGALGRGLHAAFRSRPPSGTPQSHVPPLLVTAHSAWPSSLGRADATASPGTNLSSWPLDDGTGGTDLGRPRGEPTAPRSTSVMGCPGVSEVTASHSPRALGHSFASPAFTAAAARPARSSAGSTNASYATAVLSFSPPGSLPGGHRTVPRRLPSGASARNAPAGEIPRAVQSMSPAGSPPSPFLSPIPRFAAPHMPPMGFFFFPFFPFLPRVPSTGAA